MQGQRETSCIIGDFNFKMRETDRMELRKEFSKRNCFASFIPNITNRPVKTHDGVIVYPNRP